MADTKTYKEGDTFNVTYKDAPVPPEKQYKIGQQISIRENGVLVALYEVTKTDDTSIEGRITRVFKVKVPTSPPPPTSRPTTPPPADPRKTGPAANKRTKPL